MKISIFCFTLFLGLSLFSCTSEGYYQEYITAINESDTTQLIDLLNTSADSIMTDKRQGVTGFCKNFNKTFGKAQALSDSEIDEYIMKFQDVRFWYNSPNVIGFISRQDIGENDGLWYFRGENGTIGRMIFYREEPTPEGLSLGSKKAQLTGIQIELMPKK